jgi:hypothetical protein
VIHIRLDDNSGGVTPNEDARFACGLAWPLPEGDKYRFEAECVNRFTLNTIDCRGCNPAGPQPVGTPLSQLSGRAGHPGYDEFCRIAKSWGHD